jgi:hypothetical protein
MRARIAIAARQRPLALCGQQTSGDDMASTNGPLTDDGTN